MELSQVRKIVESCFKPMKHAMMLNIWYFHVRYGALPGTTLGECTLNPKYYQAQFTFDPAKHDERSELLATMRHEFIHVLIAEMELFKEHAHQPACTEEGNNMLDVSFRQAVERSVTAIENMMDQLGFEPEALVRKGRRLMAEWQPRKPKKAEKPEKPAEKPKS